MKLSLNKNLMDYVILIMMVLQVFVLEFFGLGPIVIKFNVVLIVLRILYAFKEKEIQLYKNRERKYFVLFGLIFVFFALSSLFSAELSLGNIKSNFLTFLYPLLYAYYIRFICVNRSHIMHDCFEKGLPLFNGLLLLNFVVLYIQILFPYSINAIRNIPEVTYYPDLISGLFEYCSVHLVNIFFIFVLMMNYEYTKVMKNKTHKKYMYIYMLFLLANEIIISTQNDNKMFFPVFLVVILCRYIYDQSHQTKFDYKKVLYFIGALIGVVALVYFVVPPFRHYVDESIFGLFQRVLDMKNNTEGSAERVAIFFFALSQPSTWLFGKGFGTSYIYASGFLGFPHFGQSDLGSLLVLGGMAFTFVVISYYAMIVLDITSSKSKNKVINFFNFAFLVSCMILFTQMISRTNLIVVFMLLMLTYKFVNKNEITENKYVNAIFNKLKL